MIYTGGGGEGPGKSFMFNTSTAVTALEPATLGKVIGSLWFLRPVRRRRRPLNNAGEEEGGTPKVDLAHFEKSLHHKLFMDLHQIFFAVRIEIIQTFCNHFELF